MLKTSVETKVGILFLTTVIIIGVFVYLLGIFNPFTPTYKLFVTFKYAGGLAKGSPVRLAGVKVGRVSNIEFISDSITNDLRIKVTLLLRKTVKNSIKKDSEYYINMSGLIGEKYVEIKQGNAPEAIPPKSIVKGVDPPRIDQLISQSYDLFSKLEVFLKNNKGNLTRALNILENLSTSINKLFANTNTQDGKNIRNIIANIEKITSDFQEVASKSKSSLIPVFKNLDPTVASFKRASAHIEQFSKFVATLNKKDKTNFEKAVVNLSGIATSLNSLSTRLEDILKQIQALNPNEFKVILTETGVKVRLF